MTNKRLLRNEVPRNDIAPLVNDRKHLYTILGVWSVMKIASMSDLGRLAKEKRKTLGLNQTELGVRLGMTRQWVASVEAGKETVAVGALLKLCEALDIPLLTSEQRVSQINTFSRFFAEGVAKKIADSHNKIKIGEGEAREAAVLFVDLKSFTHLTKQAAPNEVLQLLGEYQTIVVKAVTNHDGDIDKFLGDGIMVSFGAATGNSTYAREALSCAEEIVTELDKWRRRRDALGMIAPEVGIGIAVGEVIFGAVGNDARMEFTVIGEAVNLASKLEKHTRKEKADIITTRKTFDLGAAQGYVPSGVPEIISKVVLRGMVDPLDLVILPKE